ncbi:MAG: S53 family peptidase [Alphaproteobacteria bacterium]
MPSAYVAFPSSDRKPPPDAQVVGEAPRDEAVEVSIYLKRKDHDAANTPAKLKAVRSDAHQMDIELVGKFAREHGLRVVATDPARRLVKLSGSVAQMETAFQTKLQHYQHGDERFRGRTGCLSLPEDLAPYVEAVLGLDARPATKPRLVVKQAAQGGASYAPNAVGAFYNYPAGVIGAGQCIALIELGGGYLDADTQAAFRAMGLKAPSVVAVSVDGGQNKPTPDDGANAEVALDIQVAGGAAPGAKIAVYFAPNTEQGFVDAITQATADQTNKPSVISISWGAPETYWTQQAMAAMTSAFQDAAAVNISVFCASGDNLAGDGVGDGKAHTDFPASSPWAIGCGGTTISVANNMIKSESAWNSDGGGTGGGISDVYPVPAFQNALKGSGVLPPSVNDSHYGRGVPDVAGDADPNSGYLIFVNGAQGIVGGTSAVAPLWAALAARINEKAPRGIGFFLPTLYATPTPMRAITQGDNKSGDVGYSAGAGWSACTGLGAPDGQKLYSLLITPAAATSTTTVADAGSQPVSLLGRFLRLFKAA